MAPVIIAQRMADVAHIVGSGLGIPEHGSLHIVHLLVQAMLGRELMTARIHWVGKLGGTLDVFSGQARRAPVIWQKLNLEWLYRCFEEPKRFRKIKKLPQFIFRAWRKRLGIK